MEDWSFPPKYDSNYLPDPSSKYWFKHRETMPAESRNQRILQRLQEVTRYAYKNAPFYRRKWQEAGFHPDQLKSLEDFEEKVPVITKPDLREAQERSPVFGDYLCVPEKKVHHIHGTSGTTGNPTAFAISHSDWHAIANAHARIMWGMGLRPGDTIFIAAAFSLYWGSWGALIGSERLRAASFPFGAGAHGMTARAVSWLKRFKPTAFYGTPSYALHLAEVAKEQGVNPCDFGFKLLFFSGEPGASIPGVRDKIRQTYDARVIDSGTMGEMAPWMSAAGTAETDGLVLWQDIVYSEVCDPQSFKRVPFGKRGTLVYTHLERCSQPMIRMLSGDLTLWENGPTPCGRTYPHLPNGIFGRIDDSFTIRGENIYPSEIESVLSQMPNYGGEHRIIISREGAMDELFVQVEEGDVVTHAAGNIAVTSFHKQVEAKLQQLLGIRSKVSIVAENSLSRSDHKAQRVIDDREIFQQFDKQLQNGSQQ